MNKKNKKYVPTRVLVYRLVFGLSIIGLIVPFAAEFVLPFFFKDVEIAGVSVWNQYISMILGVVAAIMSVVSLVLCYQSEKNTTTAYHQIEKTLAIMQAELKSISKKQDDISNNVQRTNKVQMDNTVGAGAVANDERKP